MKTVLTIAGSDCGGAGGIQADIKTITAHNLYATSVITSMTAQNTTGVYDILESTPKFLGRQLECVFEDIVPDAIKVGMVSNETMIDVIAEKLRQYEGKNIVLDTNIVSNSGRRLIGNMAEMIIRKELVPLATVILPSIAEAETMSGITIDSVENMCVSAGVISEKYGIKNIFFKEGHRISQKGDMLFENGRITWIPGDYSDDEGTMGKSCALSAALACNLAEGYLLVDSIIRAKRYVTAAVKENLFLGKGRNPVNYMVKPEEENIK